ncbi:MAG: DUF1015 family protein [Defluviitaleaceae bacterium]|nr:DUF1015 family protein [Defluviitaleaceae bacterium]
MARVHPFAAYRPAQKLARDVAAPPYDVLSTEEARELAKGNPYSFLRVDKAEIDLPAETSPYDAAVYGKARENLDGLIKDGVLVKDDSPCFYLYRQTLRGRSQTGLVACAEVAEYKSEIIKKHELTRTEKLQDRIAHIKSCSAHTGPIFLAYDSGNSYAKKIGLSQFTASNPEYDFISSDGVRHMVWAVNNKEVIKSIADAFESVPALYIADGHHRCEAAAQSADYARIESTRFLSVIFPHDELTILDYNRIVRDLNGMTPESFERRLGESFEVTPEAGPVKPEAPDEYGMYLNRGWRRLKSKKTRPDDVVDGLAVSVLQDEVLAKILNIINPQTDKRIDFVGGARGTAELERYVDEGQMAAAFTVCPTSMGDLLAVSNAGRIMPPKSTWFEPKLRCGLFVHRF